MIVCYVVRNFFLVEDKRVIVKGLEFLFEVLLVFFSYFCLIMNFLLLVMGLILFGGFYVLYMGFGDFNFDEKLVFVLGI